MCKCLQPEYPKKKNSERIRFLFSIHCSTFTHTESKSTASKVLKYLFRPFVTDLALLIRVHLSNAPASATRTEGKCVATTRTVAIHAPHRVSQRRWRKHLVYFFRIVHRSRPVLEKLYRRLILLKDVATFRHDSAACTPTKCTGGTYCRRICFYNRCLHAFPWHVGSVIIALSSTVL